jgi:hypothetical protein
MSYTLDSTTTFDKLLTNVKEDLGLEDTTAFDFHLNRYLKEAAADICSLDDTEQRQEVINIMDKRAKLPCGFIMFNKSCGWRFTDNGNPLCNWWYEPVVSGGAFFKNNGQYWTGWNTVQRVGNYLFFDEFDAGLPDQIEISGLFLKLNPDGSTYIPENQNRPIVAYACWKFARSRMRFPQFGFTVAQLQSYEYEWKAGKAAVEANSKMPDAMERQVLKRMWSPSYF